MGKRNPVTVKQSAVVVMAIALDASITVDFSGFAIILSLSHLGKIINLKFYLFFYPLSASRLLQECLINVQIHILKYIKDHPNILFPGIQKGCHRPDRNLSCLIIGKMKYSGGNAAESNAPAAILHSQFQTGTVTICQKLTVLLLQRPRDDRPKSMWTGRLK